MEIFSGSLSASLSEGSPNEPEITVTFMHIIQSRMLIFGHLVAAYHSCFKREFISESHFYFGVFIHHTKPTSLALIAKGGLLVPGYYWPFVLVTAHQTLAQCWSNIGPPLRRRANINPALAKLSHLLLPP